MSSPTTLLEKLLTSNTFCLPCSSCWDDGNFSSLLEDIWKYYISFGPTILSTQNLFCLLSIINVCDVVFRYFLTWCGRLTSEYRANLPRTGDITDVDVVTPAVVVSYRNIHILWFVSFVSYSNVDGAAAYGK